MGSSVSTENREIIQKAKFVDDEPELWKNDEKIWVRDNCGALDVCILVSKDDKFHFQVKKDTTYSGDEAKWEHTEYILASDSKEKFYTGVTVDEHYDAWDYYEFWTIDKNIISGEPCTVKNFYKKKKEDGESEDLVEVCVDGKTRTVRADQVVRMVEIDLSDFPSSQEIAAAVAEQDQPVASQPAVTAGENGSGTDDELRNPVDELPVDGHPEDEPEEAYERELSFSNTASDSPESEEAKAPEPEEVKLASEPEETELAPEPEEEKAPEVTDGEVNSEASKSIPESRPSWFLEMMRKENVILTGLENRGLKKTPKPFELALEEIPEECETVTVTERRRLMDSKTVVGIGAVATCGVAILGYFSYRLHRFWTAKRRPQETDASMV